jgi:predicted phage tail protein
MAVRRCPECNLINPGTATTCDCGWSFVEQSKGAPPANLAAIHEAEAREESRSKGTAQLWVGGACLVAGILITAATYGSAVADGGGMYVIAYGPIAYGLITIARGVIAKS